MDYKNHNDVITGLAAAQESQKDMREAVRESHAFVDKRDGQWEPEVIHRMKGKPRYTDDRTNPIVNQIAGELKQAQFSIKVRPAGGEATQDIAKVYDGLIRTIRNMSGADAIFAQAGKKVVKGGFAAWLCSHDYATNDSFDQDLMIEPIHDAHQRVFLDPNDLSEDGSDARWGVVLHYLSKDAYEEEFPRGKGKSLSKPFWNSLYYHKPENITIGHLYYIKEVPTDILKMSDGSVLWADEQTGDILDELEEQGIVIEETRKVNRKICCFRMFDAGGWLSDEEETVFDCVPVIPVYGNFEVDDGKILYRGVVEKLMDMQRVHNYAVSRNVEEVALAPRKKIFMTPEQAEGHEESISTMNVNAEPVQFYNSDGVSPPPFEAGASTPNAAVQVLIDQSDQSISRSAGLFAANMGDNTNLQSGVALDKVIDRGNNGTSIYFDAMERAITRTGQILVNAIPSVYDATRKVRLLREDSSYEETIINQSVFDDETQQWVSKNDLTVGKYDVICDIGPAYKNRQQEASEMFMAAMERDPSLIQTAGDIWMSNISAPGFDQIAERLRAMALGAGVIPLEQMTEQEREAMAQQPQDDTPSAEEMAYQIQLLQAQTAQLAQENQRDQNQIKIAELQANLQLNREKAQGKIAVDTAKVEQTQQRIDNETMQVQLSAQKQQFEQMMEIQKSTLNEISTLSEALRKMKDAMGADVIVSKSAASAYEETAQKLDDSLDES